MHCCLVQRGLARVVARIDIRVGSEQHLYDFSMAFMCCPIQRGFTMSRDCVDLGTCSQ